MMLPMDRRVFPVLLAACLVLACGGSDRTAGEIEGAGRSDAAVAAVSQRQVAARDAIAARFVRFRNEQKKLDVSLGPPERRRRHPPRR